MTEQQTARDFLDALHVDGIGMQHLIFNEDYLLFGGGGNQVKIEGRVYDREPGKKLQNYNLGVKYKNKMVFCAEVPTSERRGRAWIPFWSTNEGIAREALEIIRKSKPDFLRRDDWVKEQIDSIDLFRMDDFEGGRNEK